MKHAGKFCCALFISALMVGCSWQQVLTTAGMGAAAGAGIAAVYYVKGDLEADLNDDIDQVYKATLRAMEKRGYTVSDKSLASASARIDADIPANGNDKDQSLTIKMDRKDDKLTHVFIRVGIFGDEPLSRAILDDIQSRP